MVATLIVHARVPKIISDDIEIFSIGNCPPLVASLPEFKAK